MARAWIWGILAVAGCAHVRTEVTYTQTLINREIKDVVVPSSTVIRETARIDGETVIVALHSEATCRTTTTPIYQRERHLEARYEQHDAIGLLGVVTRDAQAVEVLRSLDGVGEALVDLARYWVARLEAGERGAQAQLCASRALVTRFAGAAA